MSKAAKMYQLSKKIHKWVGLILSFVFMFIATTGLLLVYYLPLGLGTSLETGSTDKPEQILSIDEVISIATSQDLPGITSEENIFRIELTPSSNVYRVRLDNNQEVQIDASSGEVLSTAPDYTGLLISLHDGYFFGNWYRYSALTLAGLSLFFFTFSGYYMVGYPLYKRLKGRKKINTSKICLIFKYIR